MLKRNLQEMFLREKVLTSIKKSFDLLEKNKAIPDKYMPYINIYLLSDTERNLLQEYYSLTGKDRNIDLDVDDFSLKRLFDKHFKEKFATSKSCYIESMSHKDTKILTLLCSLSSYLFCDKDKIKNYVFSSSITKVLYNLKPIRGNYYYKDFKKGYDISYYRYPDNIIPNIKDIHVINILESFETDELISHKYIILFKLNIEGMVGPVNEPYQILEVVDIIENAGTENSNIHSGNQEILGLYGINHGLSDSYIELISDTCNKLVDMCYASSIYLTNPTEDIISAVNEFSKKKTKREYEKKHYTSESFFNVDLNYKLVRAYEQDKEWFTNGHFRLQPVGTGRKQRRLTFVKPHTKHRRLQF